MARDTKYDLPSVTPTGRPTFIKYDRVACDTCHEWWVTKRQGPKERACRLTPRCKGKARIPDA